MKYSVIFLIFFSQRVTVIDASFQHNMIRPFVHWAYSMRERRAREMGGRGSRGGEDESYGKQQSKREGAREHRGGTKERGYRKRKRGTKRKERGFQQRTDSIIYIPAAYRCIVRGKHVREDAGRCRNHARPPITRFSLLSFLHKDVHSFSSTLGLPHAITASITSARFCKHRARSGGTALRPPRLLLRRRGNNRSVCSSSCSCGTAFGSRLGRGER